MHEVPRLLMGQLPLEQFLLFVLAFSHGFGKGFDAVGGVFELLARQQFRKGENLKPRVAPNKIF